MSEKIKAKDLRGIMYLFKNDRLIREKSFYHKWDRVQCMKEFNEIAKIGTEDWYYITIKLDI